jgi:hypothetical protein
MSAHLRPKYAVRGKNDDLARRQDKDHQNQSQQRPCGVERIPFRPIEDPMVVLKVLLVANNLVSLVRINDGATEPTSATPWGQTCFVEPPLPRNLLLNAC